MAFGTGKFTRGKDGGLRRFATKIRVNVRYSERKRAALGDGERGANDFDFSVSAYRPCTCLRTELRESYGNQQ